ncbi:hypothetical protein QJS10_CPB17g00379 [Acorus calamus]|uniref:Disease resistance N-terminal domain-containing protein n=1 Tax=Acorus calamus TaxID=4465 RepID=A0AAV9CVK4_ACOCL|nr:hypothetical protein QJS10_CPB17g00379 [Acorus calamus]
MAEAVVNSLIHNIRSVLDEDGWLREAVLDDMKYIQEELKIIRSIVNYIERRSESADVVAIWLKQLQDTAYDIEDIVDEFDYLIADQERRGFCTCYARFLLIHRSWGIAERLKKVRIRITEISGRGSRYGFYDPSSSFNEVRERTRGHIFVLSKKILMLLGRRITKKC